jgi:hypothetical protein
VHCVHRRHRKRRGEEKKRCDSEHGRQEARRSRPTLAVISIDPNLSAVRQFETTSPPTYPSIYCASHLLGQISVSRHRLTQLPCIVEAGQIPAAQIQYFFTSTHPVAITSLLAIRSRYLQVQIQPIQRLLHRISLLVVPARLSADGERFCKEAQAFMHICSTGHRLFSLTTTRKIPHYL